MLTNGTKRRIDTARDILVGKLPDPKTQVEQITIALIYKFMDDMDKQSEELGGRPKFFTGEYKKYSWSKIFDPRVSGHELVGLYGEAVQRMNQNPNIPQLFRDIFKNAYLPYRDPETLKSFLKCIGEFEYDHSEKLGDAFEYLLSVMGSQGDAGQFRTPRHIIDFIVKVVDPGKNETILDPACGTAGFLISSYKHILEKNKKDGRVHLTPAQKKRLIENFSGYDISPDMVRLSLVNMYLHGFKNPKIYEYDTLTSEEKWQEVFDVILANPPFMSPKGGIRPHKRFSVQAKRSEVLFVDYITEHLNPNGRAGIIVPEGIIFQSGTAYKKLRKMLVDRSLYVVVSLPAGVFNPYSGVKTSILMLDKNLAKKTNRILFIKINNDGFGLGAQRREVKGSDLPLALEVITRYKQSIIENKEFEFSSDEAKLASLVEQTKIAESGDYNLNGNRYSVSEITTTEYPVVKLEEVAKIIAGQSPEGKYYNSKSKGTPFYQGKTDFGNIYLGKPSKWTTRVTKVAVANDILMSVRAPVGPVNICSDKICIGRGLSAIHVGDRINYKYLFYLLKSKENDIKGGGGSVFDSISRKQIENIKIPLPSLEVQEQIIAELDSYQKIIEGACQVVENYKPHIDINPDWEMVEFKKVCSFEYGSSLPSKNRKGTKYPVMGSNGIAGYHDDYIVKGPAIIIGRKGSAGEVVWVDSNCFPIDTTYYVELKDKSYSFKFLYFVLQGLNLPQLKGGAGIPGLNRNDVYRIYKLPYPSVDIQKRIVAQIEKEQKAVEATKDLITLFEQKIKQKIREIWGKEK
ncbi:MAG: N-6 DNA methylase [Candidatus Aureabacteria bacterium]|nr:N-6 DNA methylase [Candidatus Auribacterota bacterium]